MDNDGSDNSSLQTGSPEGESVMWTLGWSCEPGAGKLTRIEMERNPATIRPGLAQPRQAPWVAAPGLVVRPDQERQPVVKDRTAPESRSETSVSNQVDTPNTDLMSSVAKLKRITTVAILTFAALSILVVLAVSVYIGLASVPAAAIEAQDGAAPQRAGLLVWLQGLGVCLALVVYFEGERLRAFFNRLIGAKREQAKGRGNEEKRLLGSKDTATR